MNDGIKEVQLKYSLKDAEKKSKVFFPNLDGLRFFCFLSVFFFHSFTTSYSEIYSNKVYQFIKDFLVKNGILGVNFFFVLSGFLITYLLLSEKDKYGRINVGNFYIRRILKIWPLFYFCVFFGFFIFPQLKLMMGEIPNETASIGFYLTFLNNFDFISKGFPDSSNLGILWSVAVEEQFYILWPILLFISPSRFYQYIFLTIVIFSFIFRLFNASNGTILEFHTISCLSDITVGAIFAFLSFYNRKFISLIKHTKKTVWIGLYVLIVLVYLYRQDIFNHGDLLLALDRLVISILFGLVIVEQNFANRSFYKMSSAAFISKMGMYTYGLYCLHTIGILIAAKGLDALGLNKNVYQVIFLEGGLSLLLTIGLAILSYHLFESKFLKLKNRFARIIR